ncbi:MAG: acetyltransferase [bacterium]
MRSKRIVIIGAGGHGKVVADLCDLLDKWCEIVFLDDRYPALEIWEEWQVIGRVSELSQLAVGGCDFALGIGSNTARKELMDEVERCGGALPSLIHPRAVVSKRSLVGNGTVIFANAAVNIGTEIGKGDIINTGASVDHDCRLGAGVHICPGVHLAGSVCVGDLAMIGVGSSVKQGISIGAGAMVGAGAAVVSDIPQGCVVTGVPAKPIKTAVRSSK